MLAFGLALTGAVLLWLPAFRFRIDGVSCPHWPAPVAGAVLGLAYAAAVALLTAGWLRALRAQWSLGRVLALGAIVHAVAAVAPPFASNDPLFYAALGRAMAHGGSPARALSLALPADDRFLALLPAGWRDGNSPYGPLFNQLAYAIARLGGDDLTLQLRLYQALNLGLLVAAAAFTGAALGARAATLLLFAPLAIVDGTVNPHNDVLVALAVALFVLATMRGHRVAGVAALAAAVLVKVSALLLLSWDLLRVALRPLAARVRASTLLGTGAIAAALTMAALVAGLHRWVWLRPFAGLIGDPAERYPHFTRSVESLPRALLGYVAHAPVASWTVGLAFRAAAALWIAYCALRAATPPPLRWAALALFGYYLFLHAYLQSWYLIPLLPLATQLPERVQPALRVFCVCLTAYYALHLPLDCDGRPVVIVARELIEAMWVVLPAAFTLLAARRPTAARASAAASPPAA
jgi:hypothetical protein